MTRPADLFLFRNATEPLIARDGSVILATVTRRDHASDRRIPSLWATRDRATWTELAGTAHVQAARLSPGGDRVALVTRDAGRWQLLVHDFAAARVLLSSATPLREPAWSPDGTTLAFQQRVDAPLPAWLGFLDPPDGAAWAERPRHTDRLTYRHDAMGELPESVFHIFTIAADGAAPARQVTQGPWHFGFPHHVSPGLCWTPDGARLLVAGTQRPDWDRKPGDIDIHAVALADGAVARLTDIPGSVAHPLPSPDGRLIAFTAAADRGLSHHLRRLFVMPAEGGAAREVLPGLDRSIAEVAWTGDGALVVAYESEGSGCIARVGLDGTLRELARDASGGAIEMPYGGHALSVARDGTVAYLRSAVDLPCEVGVIAPGEAPASISRLNEGLGPFRPAEAMWVAGGEGRQVQAWLMLPEAGKAGGPGPHPLALEIHGGPYAQYGERFSFKYQALAAAGYAVLFCNPCGSTGYGQAFADALHDRFPGPDFDDLMACVDAACARPDIDADALFVSGVSGGGVLTLWAVTHTHRFRAAASIKPVVNWESWVLGADIGPTHGLRWMGDAKPWEAPEAYRARSPLAWAQHARTPVLLMAGESDSRTPMAETLQMYAALKLAGCPAELLRFPATSHSSGSMRPSLFAAEVAAIIGWFDRHRG